MNPKALSESLKNLLNKQKQFSPEIRKELHKIIVALEKRTFLDNELKAELCMKMIAEIRKPFQESKSLSSKSN